MDVINPSDDMTSLREAVFITNSVGGPDTIDFAASLAGKTILLNLGELAITDSVGINWSGQPPLTIDASGSDPTPAQNNGDGSRIFRIDDGNNSTFLDVAIRGLHLTGGDSGFGGSFFGGGGAITTSENLSLSACTISGNFARGSGGGVSNAYGSLTIDRCTITGNSSEFGGGVSNFRGSLIISASTISGNTGSSIGPGGIANSHSNLTIRDSQISNNTGGGIRTSAPYGRFTTNIARSSISGNTGNFGAGIYAEFVDLTVTDSAISENMAMGYGGGISARGLSIGNAVTLTNTLVSGNTAQAGGGVYADRVYLRIHGGEIRTNSASNDGGGIRARYADVAVNNCTISDNDAANGGGIWTEAVSGASTNIFNSAISGNTATGKGGGIYGHYGAIMLTNSRVSNNQSQSDGAGIHSTNNRLTVSRSTIADNTAVGDFPNGGGIFIQFGDLVVANSTISGNSATRRGGGIYSSNNYAQVVDSTISGNTAVEGFGGHGGGISHGAGSLAIVRSTITLNQAVELGGLYSSPGAFTSTTVTGSIISGNQNGDVGWSWSTGGGVNSVMSHGFNLVGDGRSSGAFNQPGDQTGVTNPMLGALANNGGPTMTHALLPNSPALDAGDPGAVVVGGVPQNDQRGAPYNRIFDGDGAGGGRIDIGAFELQPIVAPSGPEIVVLGRLVSIADGDTTPGMADDTDFGTMAQGATTNTRTFLVFNDGNTPLTLGTVTAPAGFTVTTQPESIVAPGDGTHFEVRLDTATVGTKSGDLNFTTNDSDENPFNFRITGTVGFPPEIVVRGRSVSIADGDTTPSTADNTDFGTVAQGGFAGSQFFIVHNVGGTPLMLGTVTAPAGFTVTTQPESIVAPGDATSFDVRLDTATVGTKSGDVSFTTNDSNENPFNFRITGTVSATPPAAEIVVLGNSVSIADGDTTPSTGDHTNFGFTTQGGATVVRSFTVRNDGGTDLTLGSVAVPTGFTVTDQPDTSVSANGGTTTFTVRLDTGTVGTKSGDVSFTTSDSNENPFNFRIAGTVEAPVAEIVVLGNGVSISDGDTTPDAADHTNFGTAVQGGTTIIRTFFVRNDGTAALTLGTVTAPAGFTVTSQPASSVGAGGATLFTVRLDTATAATKTGDVSFVTNDSNENPFNFRIAGTVNPTPTAPEITVLGNGMNISDGDTTPGTADHTDFGTVALGGATISRTFTVRNDGTAALTLGSVTAPTGFTVTTQPAASVAANGGTTTFTVRLDTATVGTKTGDVSFATSDSNENPFNFRVTGNVTTSTSPAITGFTLINADTDQAIRTIVNGDTINLTSLPTTNLNIRADTNAGPIESVRFGFDGNNSYRVENLAPYALFSDQAGNYHAGILSVGSHTISATPFAADNAGGSQGIALSIAFSIVNSAAVPEITVLGNGVSITDGDTTPSTADHTDFGSVTQGGATASRTFTVRNDGGAALTVGTVTAPTGFTVTTQPATSVAAGGGTTTFTVRLDTATAGIKSGDVSFTTNDSDENPFNFRITGTVGTGAGLVSSFILINADTDQEIRIIADGDTVNLAGLPTMNLNIRAREFAGPIESVRFGFDGNNNYRVENLSPYALFSDQAGNYHAGILSLGSHSLSATPFAADNAGGSQGMPLSISFSVINSPGLPEITVLGAAVVGGEIRLTDGDTTPSAAELTDFGTAAQGGREISHTFTVRNDGSTALTLGTVTVPTGFTVTAQPATSVAVGGTTQFTVRLDTATAGTKTGDVSFTTNDADENPFNFRITGTVSTAPELVILSGNVYHDRNDDGNFVRPLEEGIGGVVLKLLDEQGNDTGLPATTNSAGFYEFMNLAVGTYALIEIQPAGWFDGKDTPGNLGGVAAVSPPGDMLSQIVINSGQTGIEYNFGELLPGSIGGRISAHSGPECDFDNPEILLAGVRVDLFDDDGNLIATTQTNFGGEYAFAGLRPGTYGVREQQPAGYYDGEERVGTAGGLLVANDTIGNINLGSGADAAQYDFCEELPASISGRVHADSGPVCDFDNPEIRLQDVTIELRNALGQLLRTTTTNANGDYRFDNLEHGEYQVREIQPAGYVDGEERVGTAGGVLSGTDSIVSINLHAGTNATQYDFCEVVPAEITVLGNDVSITDGDTTPSTADHTNFGTVAQGAAPIIRTFTVLNIGNGNLTLGTVTAPTGFTVTAQPAGSLAVYGTTTFTVRLDTATAGTKTGDVSFTTNDSDENPFNFRITGTVGTGSAVTGFTLINADTDQAIRTIVDGDTINLASLPTTNLNIRADTNAGPIESVRFGFDGNNSYRVENLAPYALFSDQAGNYHAGILSVGSHTISATPFAADNAGGSQGIALSISFTVVSNGGSSTSLFEAVDAVFEELSMEAASV
jgi:hypothetical protein